MSTLSKISIATALVASISATLMLTPSENTVSVPAKYQSIEKKAKQDRPDLAATWWAERTRAPKGQSSEQLKQDYVREILAAEKSLSKLDSNLVNLSFEDIGSGNFGGRLRALVVSPTDADTAVMGAVSGGFWKTEDRGQNWRAIDDFLPTLAISSLIIDPDNPQRLFAGTGEGFFNLDAQSGAGIFVSEDFGESWSQLASTTTANFKYVNRVARIANSSTLIAATREGLYVSHDLGESFERAVDVEGNGRGFVDVKASPSNANLALAVHYGDEAGAPPILQINSPGQVQGDVDGGAASFGPAISVNMLTADIVLVNDGSETTSDACEDFSQDLSHKIALIDRGTCTFVDKVQRAQDNGAIGVVVVNNESSGFITMGGDDEDNSIQIPSMMIAQNIGNNIKNVLNSEAVNATFTAGESLNFLLKTVDGGQNWQKLSADQGLPSNNVGRMELAYAQTGRVYVAAADGNSATRGLWLSNDEGLSFTKTGSSTAFIERQGWYDLTIAVDPQDENLVYLGAVDMYKTTDAGESISIASYWAPAPGDLSQYVHADHHVYAFGPDNALWAGTDGGIYISTDQANSFKPLNNGLNISQPYGIAVSPDGTHVAAGNQDNGSQIFYGDKSQWVEWIGGDGMMTVWDPVSNDIVFGELQNGNIYGSDDKGSSSTYLPLPEDASAPFVTPLAISPLDGNQLMAGAEVIYYAKNAHDFENIVWEAIPETSSPNTMSFSQHDENLAFYGDVFGGIYRLDNLSGAISSTSINGGGFLSPVTSIEIDPNDSSSQTLYITLGGYGFDRIRMTSNGGNSWNSLQSNLPLMPSWKIRVDPLEANRLWLGTELGLWTGIRSGTDITWSRYEYGTAFTRVVELIWQNDNTLFVGTHGRGTFKASRNFLDIEAGTLQTADNCDQDNYLDPGETAILPITLYNQGGANLTDIVIKPSVGAAHIEVLPVGKTISQLEGGEQTTVHFTLHSRQSANGQCMQMVDMTVHADHASGSYSEVINLTTHADASIQSGPFFDGAEDGQTFMVSEALYGGLDWKTNPISYNSGSKSWFAPNIGRLGDGALLTPWLNVTHDVTIDFALKYNTEGDETQRWDGVIMEVRTATDPENWMDIGQFSSVPYDGTLFNNNTAPGRLAWSGIQDDWRQAQVDLGSDYLGDSIQIRYRMITDQSASVFGFYLDDLSVSGVSWETGLGCSESCDDGFIPYRGMGYDITRNGHGFELQRQGDQYYLYFYSYDADNNPEWFLGIGEIENGVFTTGQGGLYRFNYQNGAASLDTANSGTASLDFNITADDASCAGADRSNAKQLARFDWDIDGQSDSWCTELFLFSEQTASPDFSGSWSVEDTNSGWGMTLNTQGNQIAAILYFYDSEGKPRWLLGAGENTGSGPITLEMNQYTGFCRTCTPTAIAPTAAGTLTLDLSTLLSLGSSNSSVTVDVQYQGNDTIDWQRSNVALIHLSDPIQP